MKTFFLFSSLLFAVNSFSCATDIYNFDSNWPNESVVSGYIDSIAIFAKETLKNWPLHKPKSYQILFRYSGNSNPFMDGYREYICTLIENEFDMIGFSLLLEAKKNKNLVSLYLKSDGRGYGGRRSIQVVILN